MSSELDQDIAVYNSVIDQYAAKLRVHGQHINAGDLYGLIIDMMIDLKIKHADLSDRVRSIFDSAREASCNYESRDFKVNDVITLIEGLKKLK